MICRTYDIPGGTLEQYDEVSQHMGSEKPEGAHLHIAVKTDDGFRVIEVWDSAEDDDRYMASGLGEAIQAAGIPQPTITDLEVHNLDWVG
jgi:hypothetical protein